MKNWYDIGEDDTISSGTTATVCLLKDSTKLVVAHVGDSRALICRDGAAKKLTHDHTATLKTEKVRLKDKHYDDEMMTRMNTSFYTGSNCQFKWIYQIW